MAVLGLDFGLARTGVAVSDEMEAFAVPLRAVPTSQLLDFLIEFREQESFRLIVLGYPLSLKGHGNPMTQKVDEFHQILISKGFEVFLFDERFSTKRAKSNLKEAGISEKRQKKIKDEMAATVLLQDYLDSKT